MERRKGERRVPVVRIASHMSGMGVASGNLYGRFLGNHAGALGTGVLREGERHFYQPFGKD